MAIAVAEVLEITIALVAVTEDQFLGIRNKLVNKELRNYVMIIVNMKDRTTMNQCRQLVVNFRQSTTTVAAVDMGIAVLMNHRRLNSKRVIMAVVSLSWTTNQNHQEKKGRLPIPQLRLLLRKTKTIMLQPVRKNLLGGEDDLKPKYTKHRSIAFVFFCLL